ncbi:MAG: hypothetical protein K9H49_16465 [Bacteroidales bacterium]|nr:hypothetical protein [Bacteroidales bacterium]MCF8390585.1 hypothetical protein [Bacteroidales bacterium]
MKRIFNYIIPIVFLSLLSATAFSQGELDTQAKILYKNERSFGVFLNSNGLQGDFSFAKRINARNHSLYQIELLTLKNPKEIKISNSYYTNKGFVFGKTNNFLEIKAQWGKQTEVYRKNDASGISVKYFYTIGPTIGILKPIYYEILYATGVPWEVYTKVEKFSTSVHQTNIYGKASFLKGVNEISFIPGASGKFGFNFEYSKDNKSINALEFGIGADIFPKNIPIMAMETNQFFYLNFFAGYRFGRVIDASEASQARKFKEKSENNKKIRTINKEQKKAARLEDEF